MHTYRDKSGLLDYTEFCEVMQCDPAPQCDMVFKLYDYDKSGHIDAREVCVYACHKCIHVCMYASLYVNMCEYAM
jgi:Ca2+-binding EF-hand superfamily protein